MKIGSLVYEFNSSIFPIDRRRSFFAWVLVMTFVLFYKMVEYIFEIGMEGSCIDFIIKNWFLLSLVLIANIAHFVIYSITIKSKLNYIINNQGLLVSYLNKYYMVPWCIVSKVNKEIGRNGTNLHIASKNRRALYTNHLRLVKDRGSVQKNDLYRSHFLQRCAIGSRGSSRQDQFGRVR